MKNIGIFDVIGPNMIGPSSSHTAGALKISLLAYKIAGTDIKSVEFILYGSFAHTYQGHGTDRALLGGIMGFSPEDKRIRDSFKIADEIGLKYKFTIDTETETNHPNTVDIIITKNDDSTLTVRGESIGGGNVVITAIDGKSIYFTGEYYTIIVKQEDVPGIVAHITNSLAKYNINIAYMRLYREGKGATAQTIIEADNKIDENVISEILSNPNIISARLIQI